MRRLNLGVVMLDSIPLWLAVPLIVGLSVAAFFVWFRDE